MTVLPVLHYRTAGLPEKQAFAEWREVMAPMFAIERARYSRALPRGSVSSYLMDDVIAHRCTFNAQHLTRDQALVAATPNHVLLQCYRSGGFQGEFGGRSVMVGRGQVAICDLARTVDARAAASDTSGLAIPRSLLVGVDLDRIGPRLDKDRERLLFARIMALSRQLPRLTVAETEAVTTDLFAFLRRLFDTSAAVDTLDGQELDSGVLNLAEKVIRANLAAADLSPASLAVRIGVSRATLYRAFAPLGGVMRHVQELRLEAVRDALADPLGTRNIAQLATISGFSSPAHLSRVFRRRFGLTPRDLRHERIVQADAERQRSAEPVKAWWARLGG
ncbi:helix-turn-helix domain-containing protein [uncultured Methylobacterium sp.]|uniref:helix-turn-helix domain-containing protein n=1 Tax=uncultured Methylobacterium sp. TaxID=157278 RepID=UPI0035CA7B36